MAMLEELLGWIADNHMLLVTKEKDTIPDDLTVVEALTKEQAVGVYVLKKYLIQSQRQTCFYQCLYSVSTVLPTMKSILALTVCRSRNSMKI